MLAMTLFRKWRGFHALKLSGLIVLLALALPVQAAELAGVRFADELELNGVKLHLNGLGLREATIFKVDVYVIALYLPEVTHKAAVARDLATGPRRVVMHFVHDVEADKMREGWVKGFDRYKNKAVIESQIKDFLKAQTDFIEGDQIVLDIRPLEVRAKFARKPEMVFAGSDFAQAVMDIWLSANVGDEIAVLQKGMLGETTGQ